MKKKIALAIVAALTMFVTSCTSADPSPLSETTTTTTPTTQAAPRSVLTPAEQSFVSAVRNGGYANPTDPDAMLVLIGRNVCSQLDGGMLPGDVIIQAIDHGVSVQGAAFITGAAVGALCPQYLPQVRDFINHGATTGPA